jgi:DNA-binding response OmpR family regulator
MGRARRILTKILIVEDDAGLQDVLTYNLRREGYTPLVAVDAPSALRLARAERPALVLLDLMLPGGSGFDVCNEIRAFSAVPIIMLTARSEDVDRIIGLEMGADDYVTKPFQFRELLARMRANLRRVALDQSGEETSVLGHEHLTVDVGARRVEVSGSTVALQPKEFDLLVYLMRHTGTVLNRDRLLQGVWGHDFVGERTVDVHVRRIRAKLAVAGADDYIRTVHGVGWIDRRSSAHTRAVVAFAKKEKES